jgi:hypothetical protein
MHLLRAMWRSGHPRLRELCHYLSWTHQTRPPYWRILDRLELQQRGARGFLYLLSNQQRGWQPYTGWFKYISARGKPQRAPLLHGINFSLFQVCGPCRFSHLSIHSPVHPDMLAVVTTRPLGKFSGVSTIYRVISCLAINRSV